MNANLDSVVSINTLIRQYLVLIYRISPYQDNIPEKKQALPVYVLYELGGENHLTSTNKDSAVSDTELLINLHSPGRQEKRSCLLKYFFTKHLFLTKSLSPSATYARYGYFTFIENLIFFPSCPRCKTDQLPF